MTAKATYKLLKPAASPLHRPSQPFVSHTLRHDAVKPQQPHVHADMALYIAPLFTEVQRQPYRVHVNVRASWRFRASSRTLAAHLAFPTFCRKKAI